MSEPNAEQAQQVLERVSCLLDEYDDASYALIVRDDDGMWHHMTRVCKMDRVVLARSFLDDVIKTRRNRNA